VSGRDETTHGIAAANPEAVCDDADDLRAPRVWVDADAVPNAVREILYRAALKRRVRVVLVANRWQSLPHRVGLEMVVVAEGADVADDYIAERCAAGELVVTDDVPLAARAVARGAVVVQPRGRVLDESNVQEHLSIRDFHEGVRSTGVQTPGQAPFGPRDVRMFASAFDRWLAQHASRRARRATTSSP